MSGAPRLLAPLVLAALVLAACGCAAAPPQQGAVTFVGQRRVASVRAAEAVREAEADLAALPPAPARPQLTRLGRAARIARERVNEARAGLPTYETAEEELPIAESEAGTGANELNYALGELSRYARHPTPALLASYRRRMRIGREKWNEAVGQLWRLARAPDPPRV